MLLVQTVTEVEVWDGLKNLSIKELSISALVFANCSIAKATVEIKGNIQVKMVTATPDKGRSEIII